MIRNQAGQVVTANLLDITTGLPIESGTVTVKVLGSGGTKTAGLGAVEHEGEGTWSYFPTKAETDFAQVTFSFGHADAVRVDVQFNPTAAASSSSGSSSSSSSSTTYTGLGDTISEAATGPAMVSVDGETVKARSIEELIKADRYLAAKSAAAAGRTGIRFSKIVPGGAAGTPIQRGSE